MPKDPRRPERVRPWETPKLDVENLMPDFYVLGALMLGMVGLVLRWKVRASRSCVERWTMICREPCLA